MPVLENVYLDRRLSGQGSLQRGAPPSGGSWGAQGTRGPLPPKRPPQTPAPPRGRAPEPPGAAPRTLLPGTPGALSCPYCGRIFCTAAELQGHVKRHRM
ncbi:unnamed protein product [Arctogadus glacialis]